VFTSDLREALTIADDLYVIRKGRVSHLGGPGRVSEKELAEFLLQKEESR